MSINAAERKLLDDRILVECFGASRKGIKVSSLVNTCEAAGFEVSGADVDQRVRYLESKTFIKEVDKALHPEVRSYTTTGEGEDYLANEGLI